MYRAADNEMNCRQAQLLMSLAIKHDDGLTDEQHESFARHLLHCPACRAQYEEDRTLAATLKRHWSVSEDTQRLLQRVGHIGGAGEPVSVADSWEDLQRRSGSLAAACRRQETLARRWRAFRRVGAAVAASVLLAVGVWSAWRHSAAIPLAEPTLAARAKASAELVTASGRAALALGSQVRAGQRPQEVLLGGKHRVVMNAGAAASFDAAPMPGRSEEIRYRVELASGELYVEVVPGHPFTVTTDNALLAITGTKFDVIAGPGRTELVMVTGSVRLSRRGGSNQWLEVVAGEASSVIAHAAPTRPREVDALAATSWARMLLMESGLARMDLDDAALDSVRDSCRPPKQADLESISYDKWLTGRRQWFAREFPWIFRAQAALRDVGVEADYAELLMVSGDIWQFHYPRPAREPIAIFSPAAIERVAHHYGVDAGVLLAAAAPPDFDLATTRTSTPDPAARAPAQEHLLAIKRWQAAIAQASADQAMSDELLLFSLRAGAYLANTRTIAYLWAKTHPGQAEALLTDEPLAQDLLSAAAAARRAAQIGQELLTAGSDGACETSRQILTNQLAARLAVVTGPVEPNPAAAEPAGECLE